MNSHFTLHLYKADLKQTSATILHSRPWMKYIFISSEKSSPFFVSIILANPLSFMYSFITMQSISIATLAQTWELGTPKGLWKTVLNSKVVLVLMSISMY